MASDSVKGWWFPARASRRSDAELKVDAQGNWLAIVDGAVVMRQPRAGISLSERLGSVPRRVTFPSGGLFETNDNDGIDRLAGVDPAGKGVDGLERFRPRLFVFAAIAVALCWAIYRFAVPVLVEVAVAVTPPIVPQLMSQGALKSLDQTITGPTALPTARQDALRTGFSELSAATGRGRDGYVLNFRKGGVIGPNAFALPDGNIVLTDELVELAGTDDAAILGVLGHEIAHVEGEHSLRQLYRAAGTAALIMLIAGDLGSAAEDILVQGSALVSLSYSRSQETAADRRSVDLMLATGKDPVAIVRFFQILQDKFGGAEGPNILSTHPATAGRMEAVKVYAEEAKARAK